MFTTSPMYMQSISGGAAHQFQRARWRAWLGQLWAAITHRSRKLLELSAELSKVRLAEQHYAGIHAVPIRQILGSENRAIDFDRSGGFPFTVTLSTRRYTPSNPRTVQSVLPGEIPFSSIPSVAAPSRPAKT